MVCQVKQANVGNVNLQGVTGPSTECRVVPVWQNILPERERESWRPESRVVRTRLGLLGLQTAPPAGAAGCWLVTS